jgi:hypothetical protein
MKHEDGNFISRDRFFKAGRAYRKKQRQLEKEWREERQRVADEVEAARSERDEVELVEGKLKREELREELFKYIRAEE